MSSLWDVLDRYALEFFAIVVLTCLTYSVAEKLLRRAPRRG
jgi:hypothetical protein